MDSLSLSPTIRSARSQSHSQHGREGELRVRSSASPWLRLTARCGLRASDGKTSTQAWYRFPPMPTLMRWASPAPSSSVKIHQTEKRLRHMTTLKILKMTDPTCRHLRNSSEQQRLLPATRDWLRRARYKPVLHCSIRSAVPSVTYGALPPLLWVRRSTAAHLSFRLHLETRLFTPSATSFCTTWEPVMESSRMVVPRLGIRCEPHRYGESVPVAA